MTAPGKQVAAEGKLHSKGSDDCLAWPLGSHGHLIIIMTASGRSSFDAEIMAAACYSHRPFKFSFQNEISHLTSRQQAIDGPVVFFFFTTNSAVKSSTCISCRDIVTTPVAWMPVSHVIATPPPSMMTFITIQSKGHQGSVARFLPFTCHRLRRRQVGPVSSHSRPLAERNRGRSFNLQKSKYLLQMLRCFHEIFQVASSLTALQLCF